VNWVMSVRSEMNYEIAEQFMKEGIEIPFPQQDIWLRNPETLRKASPIETVDEEGDEVDEDGAPPSDTGDTA